MSRRGRMTRQVLSALAACLIVGEIAEAQVRPFVFAVDERVSLKPDGSYVFLHSDCCLVFEAQIAPDLQIVGNLSQQMSKVLAAEKPTVRGYSLFATPMFRLRMFREESNPVRTPSYMPKVSLQFAWLKNVSNETTDVSARNDGPIRMILLHTVPFGHHSNGQNGCLLIGQVRPECEPKEQSAPFSKPFNTENGSFSTNYLRAGLSYHRLYPRGDDSPDSEDLGWTTKREWNIGASAEFNPKGFVGGSLSDELRLVYGDKRFEVDAEYAIRDQKIPLPFTTFTCGRAAVAVKGRYINGTLPNLRFGGSAEALCLPKGWGGTGVFVRYVNGQDYYNLNFATRLNRIQFGVTFGQPKFLMFAIPSTG